MKNRLQRLADLELSTVIDSLATFQTVLPWVILNRSQSW